MSHAEQSRGELADGKPREATSQSSDQQSRGVSSWGCTEGNENKCDTVRDRIGMFGSRGFLEISLLSLYCVLWLRELHLGLNGFMPNCYPLVIIDI